MLLILPHNICSVLKQMPKARHVCFTDILCCIFSYCPESCDLRISDVSSRPELQEHCLSTATIRVPTMIISPWMCVVNAKGKYALCKLCSCKEEVSIVLKKASRRYCDLSKAMHYAVNLYWIQRYLTVQPEMQPRNLLYYWWINLFSALLCVKLCQFCC